MTQLFVFWHRCVHWPNEFPADRSVGNVNDRVNNANINILTRKQMYDTIAASDGKQKQTRIEYSSSLARTLSDR